MNVTVFYVDAIAFSFFGLNDFLGFCWWNSLGIRQTLADVEDDGDGDNENDYDGDGWPYQTVTVLTNLGPPWYLTVRY